MKTFQEFLNEVSYQYVKSYYQVISKTPNLLKVSMDTMYTLTGIDRKFSNSWMLIIAKNSNLNDVPIQVMLEQINSSDGYAVMASKRSNDFYVFMWNRMGLMHEVALNFIQMSVDLETKRNRLMGANSLGTGTSFKKIFRGDYLPNISPSTILKEIHDFFPN